MDNLSNIDQAHEEAVNDQRKQIEKITAIINSKKYVVKGHRPDVNAPFEGTVHLSQDKAGNDQVTIEYSRSGESKVPKQIYIEFVSLEEFLKWQEEEKNK